METVERAWRNKTSAWRNSNDRVNNEHGRRIKYKSSANIGTRPITIRRSREPRKHFFRSKIEMFPLISAHASKLPSKYQEFVRGQGKISCSPNIELSELTVASLN